MMGAGCCAYSAAVAQRHVDGDGFVVGYAENRFYWAFPGYVAFGAACTFGDVYDGFHQKSE
jgi:hypothetical protein